MESFKVSTKSWHWKVYMFAVAMWAKFLDERILNYLRPNICAYIRMFFPYLPIVLILNATIYTSPLWVGVLLGHYYGYWIIAAILPYVGYAVLAIVALIVAVVVIVGISNIPSLIRDLFSGKKEAPKAVPTNVDKSFTHVVIQSIQDKHDMFCRQIEPVDDEHQAEVSGKTTPQEDRGENAAYVEITHNVAMSLGKMIGLGIVIIVVGVLLWLSADDLAGSKAVAPRETCKITSTKFTGYGDTSSKKIEVEIQATCKFGHVTSSTVDAGTVLDFAINKPTEVQCYSKQYNYTTVRGCDMSKGKK